MEPQIVVLDVPVREALISAEDKEHVVRLYLHRDPAGQLSLVGDFAHQRPTKVWRRIPPKEIGHLVAASAKDLARVGDDLYENVRVLDSALQELAGVNILGMLTGCVP